VQDEVVRQGAELEHDQQVADPELPDEVQQLVAHRRWAAHDGAPRLDQVGRRDLPQLRVDAEAAGIAQEVLQAGQVDVPGEPQPLRRDRPDPLAEEVLEVGPVVALGLGVRLTDRRHLQERDTVRVGLVSLALGDVVELLEHPDTGALPEPAQVRVDVVVVEDPRHRARAPGRRDPNRR
jgi:hypothetical protein